MPRTSRRLGFRLRRQGADAVAGVSQRGAAPFPGSVRQRAATLADGLQQGFFTPYTSAQPMADFLAESLGGC